METVKGLLAPLVNTNALQDTMKLVVIGGTVETARRAAQSGWNSFVDSFFLTAHFSQEDYPYDWLMHWLQSQPAWGQSKEVEITTRQSGRQAMTNSSVGDLADEDEEESTTADDLVHGRKKKKVTFVPSLDTTHSIFYRGHWLRITRSKRLSEYGHCNELKISVVARNNTVLKKLVLEAKKKYEADAEHRVHIFLADSYGSWRWNGARQKRPLSSIVLEASTKEMLVNDCKDFLRSEEWYAERGIPFRRGYLLHGVPGSGKTSLIHAIAGELGLDIYVLSLSAKGMSDNTLAQLMGRVPTRCIVLLEDLDAAFTRSVGRDGASTGAPPEKTTTTPSTSTASDDSNTLSLSGLLNAIDGVAAQEGRLLFATTNYIDRLDSALSRPGRMDVWVNFTNATRWQAEGIFKCFFPYKKADDGTEGSSSTTSVPISQKNIPRPRKPSAQVIPLLEESEINELAAKFAAAIPEDEMSVASLQGYLLKNKTRPRECVTEVAAWVVKEREMREKLKKEKEEKEAKAKKEKEEAAAKKEKEEKEAKEKVEKDAKEAKERKELELKKLEVEKKEIERQARRQARREARVAADKKAAVTTPPETPAAVVVPDPIPATTTTTSSPTTSSGEEVTDEPASSDCDGEDSETSEEETEAKDVKVTPPPKADKKWVAVKGSAASPPEIAVAEAKA